MKTLLVATLVAVVICSVGAAGKHKKALRAKAGKVLSDKEFDKRIREEQNKFRLIRHAGPLKANESLRLSAVVWAKQLARWDDLVHSPDEYKYGQNLYTSGPHDHQVNPREPVLSWYSEIKDYDLKTGFAFGETDHFTQLVWKDTRTVGCARAKSKTKCEYVVCNYYPAGNIPGEYRRNVS